MGMSEFYGHPDEAESIATIHRSLELGITFLDTADMYGPFTNEELVSRAIRGKRDQCTIATKFGIVRDPANPATRAINGSPDYVRKSCEASLKRLGIDHIDLYYQHRVIQNSHRRNRRRDGRASEGRKVRYLGLSEASVTRSPRIEIHPSPLFRRNIPVVSRPRNDILATCRELGIGFVAYSPLGRGLLTGQLRPSTDLPAGDQRRNWPRFQGENFQKNIDLVRKVEEIARQKNCTASQLALAWVLAQGNDVVPIPGTKRRKYLEENAGALNVQLTAEDLRQIEQVFPHGVAAGARYPEQMMHLVNA
jgi:aryl-alcohol dehydrogenase-like predicted oxidoreductase